MGIQRSHREHVGQHPPPLNVLHLAITNHRHITIPKLRSSDQEKDGGIICSLPVSFFVGYHPCRAYETPHGVSDLDLNLYKMGDIQNNTGNMSI